MKTIGLFLAFFVSTTTLHATVPLNNPSCIDLLIAEELDYNAFSQYVAGQFLVSHMYDPITSERLARATQLQSNVFEWDGKSYQIAPVDITLGESADILHVLKDIYGPRYLSQFENESPQVKSVGEGGYKKVILTPHDSKKTLKYSFSKKIDGELNIEDDERFLDVVADYWRASFIPKVVGDFFKKTSGIQAIRSFAPQVGSEGFAGKHAAQEQVFLDGEILSKFLPKLYVTHGKFPLGRFPIFEKQLRSLNLNQNLGYYNFSTERRLKLEAYPMYMPPEGVTIESRPLNDLEKLDRALYSYTEKTIVKKETLLLGAPRMVFGSDGLPLVKAPPYLRHGFQIVEQRSPFGLDLGARNLMVIPIKKPGTNTIIDYRIVSFDI